MQYVLRFFSIYFETLGLREPVIISEENTNVNLRVRIDETYTEIYKDTGNSGTETITGSETELFRFSLNFNYLEFCFEDTKYNGSFNVEGIFFSKVNYQFGDYSLNSNTQWFTIDGAANLKQKEHDESPITTAEGGGV